jgi:hypothetical protein
MADAIDLTALASSLGDYSRKDTKTILKKVLLTPQYAKNYNIMANVTDEEPLVEMLLGDIVQPGGKEAFAPISNVIDFKTRMLKVRECKVDLQIYPQKLWKSYLGKIAASTPSDPYEVPFEQFLMDYITEKAQENIYKKAFWKGIYNSAGTTPASTMDGFRTLLKAAQIAGEIPSSNIATTGAISDSNAVDKLELVAGLIPDEYADAALKLYFSPTLNRYYNLDYRSSFGTLNYNDGFMKAFLDTFPNVELVPEPAMAGLDTVVISLKDNMVWGVDLESNQGGMIIEKEKRALNILMDFKAAPQIAIAKLVWMNDSSVYS